MERCKQDVEADHELDLKDIYERALTSWSHDRVLTMTYNQIRSTLQRKRSQNRPNLPNSINQVHASINNEIYGEIDGRPFYRCQVDDGHNNTGIFFLTNRRQC